MDDPVGHLFQHRESTWICTGVETEGPELGPRLRILRRPGETHPETVVVSPNAIGRTVHHIADVFACPGCRDTRRHTAAKDLVDLLGGAKPAWTAKSGDHLEVTCYTSLPFVMLAVDYCDGGYDLYLPVTLSSASPQEKVDALKDGIQRLIDDMKASADDCAWPGCPLKEGHDNFYCDAHAKQAEEQNAQEAAEYEACSTEPD